ncbi:MAG: response regulator [Chloroflexaceae bacterium]|nr:response regulator [Chloroflexaceae bacterium]
MIQNGQSQARLIEDLLDVARVVNGRMHIEPQTIDLRAVIHAALNTIRPAMEAKELYLDIDLADEVSIVRGDADRLQQVVWNLLSNATKFTPSGGAIQIRLEHDDNYACLSVTDTGEGIHPAFLPYVFDRFRQADSTSRRIYGGLGLGLAIVRHLVELHGGTVRVTSAGEGQGATFTVYLPLESNLTRHSDAANAERLQLDCPAELLDLRILLVDDQPDLLELLQDIFTPCGSMVQMCTSAEEALTMVQTWHPNILISDIAMPEKDGYWLINQIRALPPEAGGTMPAIALTAYVRVEDRMRVLTSGFQLYVPKPVEPVEIRTTVAHLVRTAGTDDLV